MIRRPIARSRNRRAASGSAPCSTSDNLAELVVEVVKRSIGDLAGSLPVEDAEGPQGAAERIAQPIQLLRWRISQPRSQQFVQHCVAAVGGQPLSDRAGLGRSDCILQAPGELGGYLLRELVRVEVGSKLQVRAAPALPGRSPSNTQLARRRQDNLGQDIGKRTSDDFLKHPHPRHQTDMPSAKAMLGQRPGSPRAIEQQQIRHGATGSRPPTHTLVRQTDTKNGLRLRRLANLTRRARDSADDPEDAPWAKQ